MAQQWANLAAVEKDYKETVNQLEQASKVQGQSLSHALAEGGSWYLEAVDFIGQISDTAFESALERIKDQLSELNDAT